MGTACGLTRGVSANVPLAQFRKPHLAPRFQIVARNLWRIHRGFAAKMIQREDLVIWNV